MATTSETPRFSDVHSRDLPGIRTITELSDGSLLVGTLACDVRLISERELIGEWQLLSDQGKASALERIRQISVLPEGRGFYAAAGISVWRIEFNDPEPNWAIRMKESLGFLLCSPHVVIALSDDQVWISTDSGELQLRSGSGAVLRRRSDNHSPHFAARLKDGRIAGVDGTAIGVWDAESLKRLTIIPQDGTIFSFAANPNHPMAAIKVDGRILIWNLDQESVVHDFAVAPGLGVLAWRGSDGLLAVGVDNGLHVFTPTGERVGEFAARSGARILSATFSHEHQYIYAGCDDGSIQRFSLS